MYNLLEFHPPNYALARNLGLTLIVIMVIVDQVRHVIIGKRT